ncbi:MAG: hypothetical protein RI556_12630 [Hydrogenovibrio sp.]|uniref:hypothetical protein n=1 Tax=Hydrogenovibrio sp. TaxID=2065821 RepID=UPI0028704285|nr:hypothetical protein [Hydrogenovibrio sp.]MDR9500015.1 hypothetical protein [Hydrogenovibrio sp.]
MAEIGNEFYVDALFKAALFRLPTEEESSDWTKELDTDLITVPALAVLGFQQPQFQNFLLISKVYQAAFQAPITSQQMLVWGEALRSGTSFEQIANSFLQSERFTDSLSELGNSVELFLQKSYQYLTGEKVPNSLLQEGLTLYYTGQLTSAQLLIELSRFADDRSVTLEILHESLYPQNPPEFDPNAYHENFRLAVSELIQERDQPETDLVDPVGFIEEEGTLYYSGEEGLALVEINLAETKLMVDDETVALSEGDMTNASHVDLAGISIDSLVLEGTDQGNTFIVPDTNSDIYMTSGNDSIFLNGGTGTLHFQGDHSLVDTDSVYDFSIGQEGDLLDFTSFLNKTNTSNATTAIEATSASEVAWQNGDILTVSGFGLNSSDAIADLFGAGKAIANPVSSSKAVLITADIVGDASVWYVVNQVDTGSIAPEEITQVADLVGVNNLSLVGFSDGNFI